MKAKAILGLAAILSSGTLFAGVHGAYIEARTADLHPGRCYAHGHCQKQYDALVGRLAEKWRSLDPPAAVYSFLRIDFRELTRRHGPIVGQVIRTPKLIPAS
jgi:hypothetical protein